MGLIEYILGGPEITEEQRQAAVIRITSDPGIPISESSTEPFWLKEPHPLAKSCSETVPEEVDIIIIGSGVTAASVAREIYQQCDGALKPKVAVLEARDLCSGATGRNGGHCNASGFDSYAESVEAYGKEAASKLTRFRLGHLPLLLKVAEEDGLLEESQMRIVESAFAFFDASHFEESRKALALFRVDMPVESEKYKLMEAEEARRVNSPSLKSSRSTDISPRNSTCQIYTGPLPIQQEPCGLTG